MSRARVTLCLILSLVLAVPSSGCRPPASAVEAQELLKRGDYAAAERRVTEGLARDPRSDPLWRLRLRVHLARNQPRAAVAAYHDRSRAQGESDGILRYFSLAILEWGLEHRDPTVRLAALQGAREADIAELEADVEERLRDPDELVRTWAAIAVSGSRAGADVLEAQLRSRDPRARAVAVQNVARIAGAAALPTVVGFVTDRDAGVRTAAAWALALTGKAEALPPLLKLLADPEGAVRVAAVSAAARLRSAGAADAIRKLTTDPFLGVRLAAVLALADLPGGEAKAALRLLAAGDDLSVALRAGYRLSRLGEVQPALDAVAKGLVDRRWAIRAAACNTASSLRDGVALHLVRRALRDPEPRVRLAAARAVLAHRQSTEAARAAAALQRLLCGPPTTVGQCVEAAELLLRTDHAAGLATLGDLARRAASAGDRLAALRSVLTFGSARAIAVDALGDPDGRVAMAAAIWIYRRLK